MKTKLQRKRAARRLRYADREYVRLASDSRMADGSSAYHTKRPRWLVWFGTSGRPKSVARIVAMAKRIDHEPRAWVSHIGTHVVDVLWLRGISALPGHKSHRYVERRAS